MSAIHAEFSSNLDPQLLGPTQNESYSSSYPAAPPPAQQQLEYPEEEQEQHGQQGQQQLQTQEDGQADMSAMDLTFILQHNPQNDDPAFAAQFGINQVVHPNVDDALVSFDTETGSFPKRPKSTATMQADPYAAAFLAHVLGPEKWETFSSRLFERRLGGPKARARNKSRRGSGDEGDKQQSGGASAIEFLVKVEVVKEVLRTFVPHPYNPLKSLSHPYAPAPTGQVTLTRSTVLALSGWSNTQFSYWARRSEAVAVLAQHDARLRAVAIALECRLRGEPIDDEIGAEEGVTGKGLDAIVDTVKKRTGASQFLRGKHSSLDPFGVAMDGSDGERISFADQPLLVPTYQVQQSPWEMVQHEQHALQQQQQQHPQQLLAHPPPQMDPSSSSNPPDVTLHKVIAAAQQATNFGSSSSTSQTTSPPPPHNVTQPPPFDDSSIRRFPPPPPHKHGLDDASRVEYFPVSDSRSFLVSDSRSEDTTTTVVTRSSKRKLRSTADVVDSQSEKRLRSSGPVQQ